MSKAALKTQSVPSYPDAVTALAAAASWNESNTRKHHFARAEALDEEGDPWCVVIYALAFHSYLPETEN